MVEQAQEILSKELKQVVADAGYGTYENLKYLKGKGLEGYVHDYAGEIRRWLTGKPEDNRYHRFNFSYDRDRDCYNCPEGEELHNLRKLSLKLKEKVENTGEGLKGLIREAAKRASLALEEVNKRLSNLTLQPGSLFV